MKLKTSAITRLIIKAYELLRPLCLAMHAGRTGTSILPTCRKASAWTNQHLKMYFCSCVCCFFCFVLLFYFIFIIFFYIFLLTFVSTWPLPEAVKNAVYSLGTMCMAVYLFSLLKPGQRKMEHIPLHYPCSASSPACSCGEVTAFEGVHPKAHY